MCQLERLQIRLERPAGNVELAAEWAHMSALRELTILGHYGFYDPNKALLVSTLCQPSTDSDEHKETCTCEGTRRRDGPLSVSQHSDGV